MFKKAVKSQSPLRIALYGASGSGKTYTALTIAQGIQETIGGRIALIDTENSSASLYADKFDFDICNLTHPTIDNMVKLIEEAKQDYNILIIDSLTHSWQELLEEIDRLANTKYRGNSWSAWNEGTPKQKNLVKAIYNFGNIIVTMRAATEWSIQKNDKGHNTPQRIGLNPEQRKGIEYEFTMLAQITPEHNLLFEKDRTGKFQDKIVSMPTKQLGIDIINWLNTGVKVEPIKEIPQVDYTTQIETIKKMVNNVDKKVFNNWFRKEFKSTTITDAIKLEEGYEKIYEYLKPDTDDNLIEYIEAQEVQDILDNCPKGKYADLQEYIATNFGSITNIPISFKEKILSMTKE